MSLSPAILAALAPLVILAAAVLIYLVMRPRRFYFVRHGETLLNEQHIRQGAEGSLSPSGRRQAAQVGRYLKQFPIEQIISSPYVRAQETSEIIRAELNVKVVTTPLLAERRSPSEIVGGKRDDAEMVRIVDQVDRAYHADDYRFSDEENFIEVKARARKCLNYLARHGAREIVVVTHQVFLKMLIAYLLYRERLHAGDFAKLTFFNYTDNAGITICEFHPWKLFSPTRGWNVVSFNIQPEK